jgi:hypothetical protein
MRWKLPRTLIVGSISEAWEGNYKQNEKERINIGCIMLDLIGHITQSEYILKKTGSHRRIL